MLTSTKTIAMNEDILLHWIERGIFVFIALNEPKIWNVKAVYLHWCNTWKSLTNTTRWAEPCFRWANSECVVFLFPSVNNRAEFEYVLINMKIGSYSVLKCLFWIYINRLPRTKTNDKNRIEKKIKCEACKEAAHLLNVPQLYFRYAQSVRSLSQRPIRKISSNQNASICQCVNGVI